VRSNGFRGPKGDLTWGTYKYSVTRTQKSSLEGLWHLFKSLPKGNSLDGDRGLPTGGYYSQRPDTGIVIIGLDHQSVSVHRSGRITVNAYSS